MSKKNRSAGNLALQGGILAATSLIVRLIGFFYRIPLVNILGVEGMGYYSSSFDIYAYMLVISTYAMPSALSKIISNRIALKRYKEAQQIFKAALLLGLIVGLLTSSILFFQADRIAMIVGSAGSAMAMKALAPSLLVFSVLAVFRGYFQGHNTMVPTAISQVIEQVFNAVFSLSLAYLFLRQGLVYGAMGGTLGTGIGAFFGLVFIFIIYMMVHPRFKEHIDQAPSDEQVPGLFTNWQIIFMTAVPMLIGSSVYNMANLIDMVMVQRGMLFQGYEPKFVSEMYGVLAAKYRLILTLPISIVSALAAASIPSISTSMANKDYPMVQQKATFAVKIVFLISVPSAMGLGFLAKPILWMIFGTDTLYISAQLMQIGAVSVVFFSLSGISIGILQGLGKMMVPVKHSIVALIAKVIMLYILVFVFDTGLVGAVIAGVLFSIIVALTNFHSIQTEIELNLHIKQIAGVPIIAGMVMSGAALVLYEGLIFLTKSNTVGTLVAIVVAVPVYLTVLIWLDGISEEEMALLPAGRKMVGFCKKVHLM